MAETILEIKDLSAGIAEEEILHNIDLQVGRGETHVLMGHNGAGKSTLGNVIMGSPVYQVNAGQIFFEGEEITKLSVDQRAKKGIFLSFQNPLEVPGLSLEAVDGEFRPGGVFLHEASGLRPDPDGARGRRGTGPRRCAHGASCRAGAGQL